MKIWIWIFFCITVVGGVSTFMRLGDHNPKRLRVAFPAAQPALSYEPTNIHLDFEYVLLENIYSTLVEFDAHGILKPGVAEKVDVGNDRVKLKIRSGLKTQNGTPITAVDVVFSLKRLLVLSGNTHGNFRDLICPGINLQSVEDDCPGIQVDGDTVTLIASRRKAFLLPMLAAIDFAIVPKQSIDPTTLKIIDMKETSGPYFVESDDGLGHIQLRINPSHYHAARDIPEEISFVPMTSPRKGESLQALLDDRVDHIMTIDTSRSDETLDFAKAHPEFLVHTTHKIRTINLTFTERGQNRFSPQERRWIGEHVREVFHRIYKNVPGNEPRNEFFPGLGDGSLDPNQLASLDQLNTQTSSPVKTMRIGLLKRSGIETWSEPLRLAIPNADFVRQIDVPDLASDSSNEVPDAFIAATDTGFMEDIGLISYSLNAGYLGLKKNERQKWLADYTATEQKSDRMNLLRDLHYNSLAAPIIVPLIASPYTALTRKPWKMELSELYANNQLWRIKFQ